jgi:hypothetical protein
VKLRPTAPVTVTMPIASARPSHITQAHPVHAKVAHFAASQQHYTIHSSSSCAPVAGSSFRCAVTLRQTAPVTATLPIASIRPSHITQAYTMQAKPAKQQ